MRERLDTTMVAYLTAILIIAKMLGPFPNMIGQFAGRSGWLLLSGSGILAYFITWLTLRMLQKKPGTSLLTFIESRLGVMPARLTAAGYLIWFTASGIINLRFFQESLRVVILPQTSISIIQMSILLVALICAWTGFEVLARTGRFLAPIVFMGVAAIAATAIGINAEVHLLWPLAGYGWPILLHHILMMPVAFAEIHLLLLMGHKITDPENILRVTLRVLVIMTLLLAGLQAVASMILPYPAIARVLFPGIEITRLIAVGDFLQHLEGIFVFLWVFAQAIYLSACLYLTGFLWQYIWNIRNLRALFPAIALLYFTGAIMADHIVQAMRWGLILYSGWGSLLIFGVPLVVTALAAWRQKERHEGGGRHRAQGAIAETAGFLDRLHAGRAFDWLRRWQSN